MVKKPVLRLEPLPLSGPRPEKGQAVGSNTRKAMVKLAERVYAIIAEISTRHVLQNIVNGRVQVSARRSLTMVLGAI